MSLRALLCLIFAFLVISTPYSGVEAGKRKSLWEKRNKKRTKKRSKKAGIDRASGVGIERPEAALVMGNGWKSRTAMLFEDRVEIKIETGNKIQTYIIPLIGLTWQVFFPIWKWAILVVSILSFVILPFLVLVANSFASFYVTISSSTMACGGIFFLLAGFKRHNLRFVKNKNLQIRADIGAIRNFEEKIKRQQMRNRLKALEES